MQISDSHQRKTSVLGRMQFDCTHAVASIQLSIALHRRLDIPIQPAFSQFLLLVVDSHCFFLIYHTGSIRKRRT